MRFRRQALLPLDEAAAYARCHGTRTPDVKIVHLPPRRPRFEVLADGERLRRHFEARLDARDPDESGSRERIDQALEPREATVEPEVVAEDLVEPAGIAVLRDDRVPEEGKRGHAGE
jgi:hypothetical protein